MQMGMAEKCFLANAAVVVSSRRLGIGTCDAASLQRSKVPTSPHASQKIRRVLLGVQGPLSPGPGCGLCPCTQSATLWLCRRSYQLVSVRAYLISRRWREREVLSW